MSPIVDVGKAPCQVEGGNSTEHDHAAHQYTVDVEHPFTVGKVAHIGFSVIIISQNAAECEEEQGYRNEDGSRGPISLVSACWVSCTPFVEPSSGAPLNRMMKAVQVHIISVSVNTPSV